MNNIYLKMNLIYYFIKEKIIIQKIIIKETLKKKYVKRIRLRLKKKKVKIVILFQIIKIKNWKSKKKILINKIQLKKII